MKRSKFRYYEIFAPDEPITPVVKPIEKAKKQALTAHHAVAYGVLIISILKGCALIALKH